MNDRSLHSRWMMTLGVGLCVLVGGCSSSSTVSGSDLNVESEPDAADVADVVPFTATDGDGDAVDFGDDARFVAFCDDWEADVPTPAVIMLYGTDEMIEFITTVVLSSETNVDEDEIDTAELTSFVSIRAALSEVENGGSFSVPSLSPSEEQRGVEVFLFDADVPDGFREGEYASGAGPGSGEITLGPVDCEDGSEIAVELEAELPSEFGDGGVATLSGNVSAAVVSSPLATD